MLIRFRLQAILHDAEGELQFHSDTIAYDDTKHAFVGSSDSHHRTSLLELDRKIHI